MDSANARRLIARAQRRPPPSDAPPDPELDRERARANLARATPGPPPDPLTGRVPPKRRRRQV